MAKTRGDFTDILLHKKVLSPEQLEEARNYQKKTGCKLEDAIIKMGYSSSSEVTEAIAEQHGLEFVELNDVQIPPSIIELVPESVARENVVLPLAQENGTLMVIVSDPTDLDTLGKLQFILNKEIALVLAPRE